MVKNSFFLLSIVISICVLSSCGIKPSDVDAPEGAENINFPTNYPTQRGED